MRYIGLDLAWGRNNPSGAALLVGSSAGARLAEPPALLGDDDDVFRYLYRATGDDDALIAVDAPLIVPNESGRRPAEAMIAAALGRYQAGAHPANRRLLGRGGPIRGEELVERLVAELGFRHQERIDADERGRVVTEVYPHAAMIGIFGLPQTLKYKAKPGRSDEARLAAWRRYQELLRGLADTDPPLTGHEALLETDVLTLRGRAQKDYEDMIDGLMCAYIALYAHRWGAERCRTFGDMVGGYIFTPVPPELRTVASPGGAGSSG